MALNDLSTPSDSLLSLWLPLWLRFLVRGSLSGLSTASVERALRGESCAVSCLGTVGMWGLVNCHPSSAAGMVLMVCSGGSESNGTTALTSKCSDQFFLPPEPEPIEADILHRAQQGLASVERRRANKDVKEVSNNYVRQD